MENHHSKLTFEQKEVDGVRLSQTGKWDLDKTKVEGGFPYDGVENSDRFTKEEIAEYQFETSMTLYPARDDDKLNISMLGGSKNGKDNKKKEQKFFKPKTNLGEDFSEQEFRKSSSRKYTPTQLPTKGKVFGDS
jgi:hypothetical protein